uniref:WxxW domain-containing protein n=1 Tax=Sinocyclocheilus rhinocerous TaxID=307959 RepID=A0A673N178_9TELE
MLKNKIQVTCGGTLFAVLNLLARGCITKWFDRDDPNGNGDYELLADLLSTNPGEICPSPIAIEAQTISVFSGHVYNPTSGFACVNANQAGVLCADYKVRFTCPEDWCSKCRTPWFDRDNPGGLGDYETLSLTLIRYPLQVCAQPIAIEVATISGTPVLPTGNNFQVYDPTQGFACVNAQQNGGYNPTTGVSCLNANQGGGVCADYKVRFTCPEDWCSSECV